MASENSSNDLRPILPKRFETLDETELSRILEEKDSVNTKRSTQNAINTLTAYLTEKKMDTQFEAYDAEKLDAALAKFYCEARNSNGELYRKSSLFCIRYGLNRHLQNVCGMDIIRGKEFKKSNQMFQAMIKELKRQGKGLVNHHQAIEIGDLEILYNYFDLRDPQKLQEKVFVDVMLHFGRKPFGSGTGRESIRELQVDDFVVSSNALGSQCIRMVKGKYAPVKRGQGSNPAEDTQDFYMTELPDERAKCPVTSFLIYRSKLNPCSKCLFQRVKHKPTNNQWYDGNPIGHNSLGKMMSMLSTNAGLSQQYSNYSLRATPLENLHPVCVSSCNIILVPVNQRDSGVQTGTIIKPAACEVQQQVIVSSTNPSSSQNIIPLSSVIPGSSQNIILMSSTNPSSSKNIIPLSSTVPSSSQNIIPLSSKILGSSQNIIPLSSVVPASSQNIFPSSSDSTVPSSSQNIIPLSSAVPASSQNIIPLSSVVPASSQNIFPSSSTVPASSQNIFPSSSTVPSSSQNIISLSSAVPASSQNIIPLSSVVPASSQNIIPLSSAVPASSQNIIPSSSTVPSSSQNIIPLSSKILGPSQNIISLSSVVPASSQNIIPLSSVVPFSSQNIISLPGNQHLVASPFGNIIENVHHAKNNTITLPQNTDGVPITSLPGNRSRDFGVQTLDTFSTGSESHPMLSCGCTVVKNMNDVHCLTPHNLKINPNNKQNIASQTVPSCHGSQEQSRFCSDTVPLCNSQQILSMERTTTTHPDEAENIPPWQDESSDGDADIFNWILIDLQSVGFESNLGEALTVVK